MLLMLCLFFFYVGVVPQMSWSSYIAKTPNDTPRTAPAVPLSTIQPSAMLGGRQTSSISELNRQMADGTSTTTGHCRTDCQTSSDEKPAARLLPADNFGMFSVHNYICSDHIVVQPL